MSGESGYRSLSRLLDVQEFTVDSINDCIASKVDTSNLDYFIIDESNICKEYYTDKTKTKKLDKIKNLKKETVNGYHSNNGVVISDGKIQILEHKLYSTKEEDYKSQTNVALDILRTHQIQARVLLDRGYDNWEVLNLILEQYQNIKRSFTLRVSHLERIVKFKHELISINEIKDYDDQVNLKLDKIKLKREIYTNVNLKLSWCRIQLADNKFKTTKLSQYTKSITLIKAELTDSSKPVFKEPMYLFVPEEVNPLTVYDYYRSYFYRWSIEQVFKFMKEVLETDKFRIQDYKQIKKLTSLCFLVGAYFYEIGKVSIEDEFMIMINELGGNPNPKKPTLYYSRLGLLKLRYKIETDIFFVNNKVPPDKQVVLIRLAGGGS